MVKFIIIRHGYSQFNKEKKFTGQTDVPLDALGVLQAERTAEYILNHFKVDAVYSSDLSRAINTAEPVARALNLQIHLDSDLREIYLGDWQGRFLDEVKKTQEYALWNAEIGNYGDRENHSQLLERAKKVFQRIAEENEGKCVLVSSHGGVVNSMTREWLGAENADKVKFPGNASVSVVNYDAKTKTAEILLLGYNGHLVGL